MKQVYLIRAHRHQAFTLGCLQIAGPAHPTIFILERPWKNNEPNVSCIPNGEYICHLEPSNKFNYSHDNRPDIYEVTGVLGRSNIRFHPGNRVGDSLGCLLPGMGYLDNQGMPNLTASKIALDLMHELIIDSAFKLFIR